ncbi:MAG: NTP transferase domain-containing protein [Pseudonocardia sp.]
MTSPIGPVAGIVLAGGRSSRMGESKAALEWHGSTLLRRTASLLARARNNPADPGPIVVVAAPGQELPDLPPGVEVVTDPVEGRGPMQGIATGLAAVAERAPVAFVCSTDLPFLHPAFVRRVLRELSPDLDVVLPVARGFPQPLAAAYRTSLATRVVELIAQGRMRPAMLFDQVRVHRMNDGALLADPALAAADPALDSLLNVNEPNDYAEARRRPAPEIVVQRYGALASNGHRGPARVRAATLGGAAKAVDLRLDRHVIAALNGDQITRDPDLPLVAGDTVAFLSADAGG